MVSSVNLSANIDLAAAEDAVRQAVTGGPDPDASAVRAALNRATGGQASAVSSTHDGRSADTFMTIYHRYDGREHRMPTYQIAKTLTARLPNDRDIFPAGAIGQIAWSLDPAQSGVLKRDFGPEEYNLGLPCYFSAAQDNPQIVADVKDAGIPFFCRKRGRDGEPVKFSDELAREGHLKKHVRAIPAYNRYRENRRNDERDTATESTNRAILELAARLAGQSSSTPQSAVSVLPPQAVAYPPPNAEGMPEPEDDFICDVCSKSNRSAAGLAAHKRSHTEG